VPAGAKGEETKIHAEVRAVLAQMDVDESDPELRSVVDGVVAKVLKPWRRREEIKRVIEEARDTLPSRLQGFSWSPTEWDIRARDAAAKAISSARPDVSFEELKTIAVAAVRPLIAEHEHRERCAKIVNSIANEFAPENEKVREVCTEAAAKALAHMPVGTSEHVMVQLFDQGLKPLREAIAKRKAQEKAEALKRQDRAIRESVLSAAAYKLPWGFPAEYRAQALGAVRKAVDQVTEGTAQNPLEHKLAIRRSSFSSAPMNGARRRRSLSKTRCVKFSPTC
jgi:hypothetical protein